MLSFIKRYLKKYVILQCSVRIVYNLLNHIRFLCGKITTDSGTTHAQLSVKESIAYMTNVFEDYKKYAGISHFSGNVCELGPGDSSGVALNILADGALHVDLADRFYSERNAGGHAQVYQALADHNPRIARLLKTADVHSEASFPHITRYYGPQAAGETFFKGRTNCYDYIVSRSVLEHATDPLLTLQLMYKALKPGGSLIHKVDLRDHGMFTPYHHDLKFLEISKWIYLAMTYQSGLPNRILFDQYRECIRLLPGKCNLFVTQLAYAGPVEPHSLFEEVPQELLDRAFAQVAKHQKKFAGVFQKMNQNDLIVAGFFLIINKPAE